MAPRKRKAPQSSKEEDVAEDYPTQTLTTPSSSSSYSLSASDAASMAPPSTTIPSENNQSGNRPVTDRRMVQQQVAQRRAAHFARADPPQPLSLASSTPTGSLRVGAAGEEEKDGVEEWPGPFSTAHSMIQKREAAKRERDQKILQRQLQQERGEEKGGEEEEEGLDVFDRALLRLPALLPALTQSALPGLPAQPLPPQPPPSLSDLCLDAITRA
eukprot:gene44582-54518_t